MRLVVCGLSQGYDCLPLVFEVDGATTKTFAKYIKKLSEIANIRRGHDQRYFSARWKTTIAMTLAKRGAQAAMRRSHELQGRSSTANNLHDYDNGPLSSFGVEPPVVMGATDSAAPVFKDGSLITLWLASTKSSSIF